MKTITQKECYTYWGAIFQNTASTYWEGILKKKELPFISRLIRENQQVESTELLLKTEEGVSNTEIHHQFLTSIRPFLQKIKGTILIQFPTQKQGVIVENHEFDSFFTRGCVDLFGTMPDYEYDEIYILDLTTPRMVAFEHPGIIRLIDERQNGV